MTPAESWLAERDTVREQAKAEERERIAQTIEALLDDRFVALAYAEAVQDAARIARAADTEAGR